MKHTATSSGDLGVQELPWPDNVQPPPTDLPYGDTDKDNLVAHLAASEAELRAYRDADQQS